MLRQDIYLNHAGTSWPKPAVVIDAVHEAMSRPAGEWGGAFEQAHQAIAAFFGVGDPEQLLLTPGCTAALAVGIADADLGGRPRVLTSVWEHHALHRPLLKLGEAGVTLEYIPPHDGSALDLERLEDALSRDDVGLVAITAAANITGDLLPFEAVIELSHRYGAQVLLDAAQVVGWLDLNFVDLGADFVAFGGHKGLQGPWGIGGLYMAEHARVQCSSTPGAARGSGRDRRPGYCDVGSVDQAALAGLHAAVNWLNGVDRSGRLRLAREQVARIESALGDAGACCYGHQPPEQRMPTIAFSVAGQSSTTFAAALRARGVIVGSGSQCAPLGHRTLGTDDEGLVRISVGIDQDPDEIRIAAEQICELIKAGSR